MVASQDEKIFWVLNFVSQQEANGLQRLLSTIHVIAQEEIVGLRREAAVLKEAQEIIILTVNIT